MNQINIIIYLDQSGAIKNYTLSNTTPSSEHDVVESIKTENESDNGKCKHCLKPFDIYLFTTTKNVIKNESKDELIECYVDAFAQSLPPSPDSAVKDEDECLTVVQPKKRRGKRKKTDGNQAFAGDKTTEKRKIKKFEQDAICEKCGKYFPVMKNMMNHLASHNNTRDYECEHCSKKFKTKRHVRAHLLQNHITVIVPGDPKFKYACTMCDPPKRFPSSTALKAHSYTHNEDKQFPCEYCNRMLKCENNLKFHIYKFHTNPNEQKRYRCEKCPYTTVVKSVFEGHKWSHVPNSERPFKCSYCAKGFTNRFSVRKHEKAHMGIKNFICPTCGNKFGARSELKDHMRLHTGEKPYECHICFTRFGDRKRYRQHMLAHEAELGVVLDKSLRKFDPSFALKNSESSNPCQ